MLEASTQNVRPGPAPARVGAAWAALESAGRCAALAVAGSALLVGALWVPTSPVALATTWCLLGLTAAAVVDAVEHRLPDSLVALAAAPVAAVMIVGALIDQASASSAATALAVVGVPLLVAHIVAPAGLGFGDVKAGATISAGVGLLGLEAAVLGILVALFVTAAWAVAGRRQTIPLGPGLVIGAVAGLAVARVGLQAAP